MSSNPTGPDLIDSLGRRGEVIYKFTPPKPTKIGDDTPHEYIVQSLDGYGGCMIHGRYGTRWECNAPARALVLHMINRVKELEAKFGNDDEIDGVFPDNIDDTHFDEGDFE